MADRCAGLSEYADIILRDPDAVGVGDAGANHADVRQALHRGLIRGAVGVETLVDGLKDVGVDAHVVGAGGVYDAAEGVFVRPVVAGGAQKNADGLRVRLLVSLMQVKGKVEIVLESDPGTFNDGAGGLREIIREASQELIVVAVDEEALGAKPDGERGAHADFTECVQCAFGLGEGAGLVEHDGGGAGAELLHEGVETHEVGIHGLATPCEVQPRLKRAVRLSKLEIGDTATVVMGVDEAGEDEMGAVADDICGGVAGSKIVEVVDLDDGAVCRYGDGGVTEQNGGAIVLRSREDVASADEGGGGGGLGHGLRIHGIGGGLNGADDLVVAGAAAEVAGEVEPDFLFSRVGNHLEEVIGG